MSRSNVCTYVVCLHWRLVLPRVVCFTLWTRYYRATSIRTIQTPLKGVTMSNHVDRINQAYRGQQGAAQVQLRSTKV